MLLRRSLCIASVMLCIFLAGCDLPGKSHNEKAQGPDVFPPADVSNDKAIAGRIVLEKADLPEGWEEDPDYKPDDGSDTGSSSDQPDTDIASCAQLKDDGKLGALFDDTQNEQGANKDGRRFKQGEDVLEKTVSSNVQMMKTAARVRDEFAALRDKRFQRCMEDTFRQVGAGTYVFSPGDLVSKFTVIPELDSADTYGYRVLMTTHVNRQTRNVYVDIMFLMVDRAEIEIDYTRTNAEPDVTVEKQLLDVARRKAQAAMSGAPPAI